MSSARRRPLREETRGRLLGAAEKVFVRDGIGAASVEDICVEAGLTRGALYSNFANKDELVMAVIAQHDERNLLAVEQLFEEAIDGEAFLHAFEVRESGRAQTDDHDAVLNMEFVLYASRNPANRPLLAQRQRRWRELTTMIVQADFAAAGGAAPMTVDDAVNLIIALDDGYALHELIEPGSYRPGTLSRNLLALRALWLGDRTH